MIAKTTPVLIALFFVCSLCTNAQAVKLINSTAQRWAGGVAGHSGENYVFEVEFSGYKRIPKPTEIWIGSDRFPLSDKDTPAQHNMTMKRLAGGTKLRVEIKVGTFHNEHVQISPLPPGEKHYEQPPPPKKYYGKALLVYTHDHKKQYYEITEIMHQLPMVEYP